MAPSSHAADFAVDLIGRHDRRTTGMIWIAFTHVGNSLPGGDIEGQKEQLRGLLKADTRLEYHADSDSWSDKTEAE